MKKQKLDFFSAMCKEDLVHSNCTLSTTILPNIELWVNNTNNKSLLVKMGNEAKILKIILLGNNSPKRILNFAKVLSKN